jgi:mono/diheme cytochrome c family protein
MSTLKFINYYIILIAGVLFASCKADGNFTGREFAPNMYHAVPYEPLKQIKDTEAGWMVTSSGRDTAEYYNSNPNNPYSMNMRLPVKGTIARRSWTSAAGDSSDVYFIAKHIPADSIEISSRILKNPIPASEDVIAEGEVLYIAYCAPCHGETGKGDGLVGQQYKGVPNFAAGRLATLSEGHIFHTITHGRGRMWPYKSQVSPEDRWKIVHFVQQLQQQK